MPTFVQWHPPPTPTPTPTLWAVGRTCDLLLINRMQQNWCGYMYVITWLCYIIVPYLQELLSPWLVLRKQVPHWGPGDKELSVAFSQQPTGKWDPQSYNPKDMHFTNALSELGSGSSPIWTSDEMPSATVVSSCRGPSGAVSWHLAHRNCKTISVCSFKLLCV